MAKKNQHVARDNRANQLNPTHPAYHRSRGASVGEASHLAAATRDSMSRDAAVRTASLELPPGGTTARTDSTR